MAIFRGTGGSGNSTDDSIVSAVTTQAGIATTKASEAATSATTATTKASEASASATTASTKATEANASATTASTKATEANTAKTGAETAQTAAESARDTAQTHANTANNSSVQTVAGISTEVQNVNNIRTEIQNVDTVKTDVTTVAGISSNVTTVATDASDIGTVATNIANVNNVGDNIANVNAVHSNASNINTVAPKIGAIEIVALKQLQVQTVSDNINDVTAVVGLESKMDTVIADASDIGAVASNIDDVTTVSGINSEVDTVAGIAAKVTTVADNITDVQNADTNAANASTSASQASNSASAAGASATTASTKATEASNSATAASNSATTATTKATEAAGSATTAGTSASTATTKASEASASATTATTKAGEAASSASAASGDATTSTTKASEASASATSAATSATNAQTAANAWSGYFNTYLGSYSAHPTVDSQGNALQTGAFYYDTGAGSNTVGLYVYNGSSWVYSTNYNNVTAPYSLAQDLATNSHDISFGDNAKAQFGASDDLQIYHDGSNSYIHDAGTGGLYLRGSNEIALRSSSNENIFLGLTDGSAYVYHNGDVKLQTTSAGIDVTGNVSLADNGKATFGASDDLQIFHQSSNGNSIIKESGGGILSLQTNGSEIGFFDTANSQHIAMFKTGAECSLRYNGNERFKTTSTGIDVTGAIRADDIIHVNSTNYARLEVGGDTGAYIDLKTPDSDDYDLRMIHDSAGSKFISPNADVKFDVGGNTRATIKASGNVGIGTSSPKQQLHISGGTSSGDVTKVAIGATGNNAETHLQLAERFTGDNMNYGFSFVADGNDTNNLLIKNHNNSTTGAVALSVARNSGNVGIGTSSPTSKLHIDAGTSGTDVDVLRINGTNSAFNVTCSDLSTNNPVWKLRTFDGEALAFGDGTTENMRIDPSGNVLVGTTDSNIDNNTAGKGIVLAEGGYVQIAREATAQTQAMLHLNATGVDANMIEFKKDATAVGSIGTRANYIKIGMGDTNLLFNSASDAVTPEGESANRDASIDLGRNVSRFKDLYLSGGIHLGGTGSANKLDDYEEGTWTMRIQESGTGNQSSSTNANCKYTKIGNVVHVQGLILDINNDAFAGTGSLQIAGLPFTQLAANSTRAHGSCQVNGLSGTGVEKGLFVQGQSGTNYCLIKFAQSGTGVGTITTASLSDNGVSDIFFSLTYTTT